MERWLSAGSGRPGKERCRLAAERSGEGKGRAGANWKRERRSPGLAAAFPSSGRVIPVPSSEQGGGRWLTGVALGPMAVPSDVPQQVLLQPHVPAPTRNGQGPSLGEDDPEKDQTKRVQVTGFGDKVHTPQPAVPQATHAPISRSSGRGGTLGRRLWAGARLAGTTAGSGCPFPTSHL